MSELKYLHKHQDYGTAIRYRKPMPHHFRGLQYTATGYGRKIPTEWMILFRGRNYRLYCCCYSNVGTCYIVVGGEWLVVSFPEDIREVNP